VRHPVPWRWRAQRSHARGRTRGPWQVPGVLTDQPKVRTSADKLQVSAVVLVTFGAGPDRGLPRTGTERLVRLACVLTLRHRGRADTHKGQRR
jgi:hypothetical protein